MNPALDHLIVLVNDLDAAAADFSALGFTVCRRADRIEGSMLNRFICFADGSYILLSAFADPVASAGHRLAPLLKRGEGWADYSFVVEDLGGVVDRFRAAQMPTRGPIAVSSELSDGRKWSLDLLLAGIGAGGDEALPFVVQDREGREARIPDLTTHQNGAIGLAGLRVAAASPDRVIAGLECVAGRALSSEPAETGRRVHFGTGWVDIVEDRARKPGEGGLMQATVVVDGEVPAAPDPARLHGAAISFVRR